MRSIAFRLKLLFICTHLQHGSEEACTFSESIECTTINKGFERFFIDHITTRAFDEVIERVEILLITCSDDRIDRTFTESLDRLKSESDSMGIDIREVLTRLSYIRRKNFKIILACLFDLKTDTIGIFLI